MMRYTPDSAACYTATKDVYTTAAALTIGLHSVPAIVYLRNEGLPESFEPCVAALILLVVMGLLAVANAPQETTDQARSSRFDWLTPNSVACYKATVEVRMTAIALAIGLNSVPAVLLLRDVGLDPSHEPYVVASTLVLVLCLLAVGDPPQDTASESRPPPLGDVKLDDPNATSEHSPMSVLPHAQPAPPKVDKLPAAFAR